MIFTNEKMEIFKYRGRRLLVDIEEWPKNPDIQAGKIAGELGASFSEGYHTAMHEVQSSPWEYLTLYASSHTDETLNGASAQGWEFLCPFDGGKVLFRRRKAVAEIAAKEKPE
jgi:hypothetical protein